MDAEHIDLENIFKIRPYARQFHMHYKGVRESSHIL